MDLNTAQNILSTASLASKKECKALELALNILNDKFAPDLSAIKASQDDADTQRGLYQSTLNVLSQEKLDHAETLRRAEKAENDFDTLKTVAETEIEKLTNEKAEMETTHSDEVEKLNSKITELMTYIKPVVFEKPVTEEPLPVEETPA